MVRDGLIHWLCSNFKLCNLFSCSEYNEAIQFIRNNDSIKLLIGEFDIYDEETGKFLKHIRSHYPDRKALCLVPVSNPGQANNLIQAGYENLISKSCSQQKLLSAIDAILSNGYYLDYEIKSLATAAESALSKITRKERQILMQLIDGLTRDDIVTRLAISPETLKSHIKNMRKKLDAHNDLELAMKGRKLGLTR